MSVMSPSVKALLVGVPVDRSAASSSSFTDVLGWHRILRSLGLSSANIRVVAEAPGGGAHSSILRARQQELEDARRWLADADHAIIAVSGPGAVTADGRESLVLADGAFPLELLTPVGVPRVDWFLDLCRTGARPGAWQTLPGHVVHWACAPGEQAEQRKIDGRWRGLWSWSVHTVLEQWTARADGDGTRAFDIDHRELARRAAVMVQALGSGAQHSGVLGAAGLQAGAFGPGQVAVAAAPSAPAQTREVVGGWGIILDASGNCVVGFHVDRDVMEIRFGSSISSASQLPANAELEWRSPTSTELAQLGSPTIECANQTFEAVGGNGPGTSGGRLYASQDRGLWIKIKSDLSVVRWFTVEDELEDDYLTTGIGQEGLVTASSAPSEPAGGFYRSIDS